MDEHLDCPYYQFVPLQPDGRGRRQCNHPSEKWGKLDRDGIKHCNNGHYIGPASDFKCMGKFDHQATLDEFTIIQHRRGINE